MFVLRIECSRVTAVAVEVALDALGAAVTRWDEADEDGVRFEEYFCDAMAAVAPGGYLMLAGTTESDFPGISDLYLEEGFKLLAVEGDGEWRSGLYMPERSQPEV